MGLLKPAAVEQSAAKFGIFGRQGSGKTTTGILIAIGLSKTYHHNAPIALMDTENGSDYMKPIADAEGVPLLVVKSRAFADMKAALKEAEREKCCAFLVDSYTHPWQELTASFKEKSRRKRLEFHHMDELKSMWRVWTDLMLNSPLHVGLMGRLGFEWGEEENEEGRQLVKLGTKMKSESEAGYEPSLLIEMEGVQDSDVRMKKTRAKRGTIIHHAYVLKDRWRTLNGRTFAFKDLNDYKAGDYETVFKAFLPHWSRLVIGSQQRAVDGTRTSVGEFDGGESVGARIAQRKQIACEEIQGALVAMWPGQDAASKKIKTEVIAALFSTRSWTAVETQPVELLEGAVALLRDVESEAKRGTAMDTPDAALGLLEICKARLTDPVSDVEEAPVL